MKEPKPKAVQPSDVAAALRELVNHCEERGWRDVPQVVKAKEVLSGDKD